MDQTCLLHADRPADGQSPGRPVPSTASAEEITNLVLQLQQNPELLKTLSALLNAGR